MYVLPDNVTYYRAVSDVAFPTNWIISVGGYFEKEEAVGFKGTLKDFRISTGTGAIPGMPHISARECDDSVGIFAGTHDPCFLDYSNLGSVSCGFANTAECMGCPQNNLMQRAGSSSPICQTGCPAGYNGVCNSCGGTNQIYHGGTCVDHCPNGLAADYSTGTCIDCAAINGTVLYNGSCISTCPAGYSLNNFGVCSVCPSSQYYFNHSCVDACPPTTFASTSFQCEPCALGCESCTYDTNTSCIKCASGYYSLTGICVSGCPAGMYANPQTAACEGCASDCVTCSALSNAECTSCKTGFLLSSGLCVLNCPSDYYESFLGDPSSFQIPACLPRLNLVFNLTLKSNSRVVYINFNYSIADIIFAVTQFTQISIAKTQISELFYSLKLVSNATIEFEYLGDQYFPSLSVLNVTIALADSFSNDPYQKFKMGNQTATIQLSEIYPFSQNELDVISNSAKAVSGIGGFIAGGQASAAVGNGMQGSLSLSVVRMQILGELVQLLRFIDLDWPANVKEFFANAHIDPNSITIQMDLTLGWNDNLQDRNTSMPHVFQEYEVGPFFTENYSTELSNLFGFSSVAVFVVVVIYLLRKELPVLEARLSGNRVKRIKVNLKSPKLNKKMDEEKPSEDEEYVEEKKPGKICSQQLVRVIQKLKGYLEKATFKVLWNYAIMFFLTLYQPAMFWSQINFKYATMILEPPTYYTRGSLAIAVVFFIFNVGLFSFVLFVTRKNFKHILAPGDSADLPPHLEAYKVLFEDFNNKSRLQILYASLDMARSFIYMISIAVIPNAIAQMTLLSIFSLTFVLYMIICQPLKEKWIRRITLSVEIFAFACLSIGLALAIIANHATIDPATRIEIGTVFMVFSLLMTITGGLLTLIQVIEIVIPIIKFVRKLLRRRRASVSPITVAELRPQSPDNMIADAKSEHQFIFQNHSEVELPSKVTLCEEKGIKLEDLSA